MNELKINDEKLNKEMYEKLLDPTTMLNILIEKLQMYSQIESSLTDLVNMLILNSMKAGVANQMMITQIKSDIDEQLVQINRRIDVLEEKIKNLHESS